MYVAPATCNIITPRNIKYQVLYFRIMARLDCNQASIQAHPISLVIVDANIYILTDPDRDINDALTQHYISVCNLKPTVTYLALICHLTQHTTFLCNPWPPITSQTPRLPTIYVQSNGKPLFHLVFATFTC